MLVQREPELAVALPDGLTLAVLRKMWSDIFTEAPLNSRAWVFQERLLSKRILHFARNELLWECSTCSERERGFLKPPSFPQNEPVHGDSPRLKQMLVELNSENMLGLWKRIVELYTQRHITISSDKLSALSGVAELFQKVDNFRYTAGIWVEDLSQLLWSPPESWHASYIKLNSNSAYDSSGIAEYIASSWSWASYPRTVHFMGSLDALTREQSPEESHLPYDLTARHASFSIYSVYGQLFTNKSHLGRVYPGTKIVLECYSKGIVPDLQSIDRQRSQKGPGSWYEQGHRFSLQVENSGPNWEFHLSDSIPQNGSYFALYLGIQRYGRWGEILWFLVVQKASEALYTDSSEGETWIRVGIASCCIGRKSTKDESTPAYDPFKSSTRRTFVLV
jgi:hypothetical protein